MSCNICWATANLLKSDTKPCPKCDLFNQFMRTSNYDTFEKSMNELREYTNKELDKIEKKCGNKLFLINENWQCSKSKSGKLIH